VRTTRFMNNLDQVRSNRKIEKPPKSYSIRSNKTKPSMDLLECGTDSYRSPRDL